MSLRGPKNDISNPPHSTRQNLEPTVHSSEDRADQEGSLKPPSDNSTATNITTGKTETKPRHKSWLQKWRNLTNPQAEFSDEFVKERTGMTKAELAEWLQDPKNKKKAEKLWPSAVYWATIGGRYLRLL